MGIPIVIESTFLQIFLRSLGASGKVIGLIPSFFFIGVALFGILAGYLTGHLENKRRVIIITHLYGSVPIPVFGLIFLLTGVTDFTLPLFLIIYACFSLGVGLVLPIWQNYLVMLFSERKIFPALAGIMFAQSVARVVSSFIILRIIQRYSMDPRSSALIFIGVGALFFIGTLFYLFTEEVRPPRREDRRQKRFFRHLFENARMVFSERKFIRYLLSDIETFGVIGMISFYAVYAVEHHSISEAYASGLFIACIYGGYVAVYILLGWLNLLSLKRKFFLGKITALGAVALLLTTSSLFAFLAVSFLLGVSRGVRTLAYPPAVKKLSGRSDATPYFALAPILVLPLSAGLPFVNGLIIDGFVRLGPGAYKIVFGLMGVIIILGLIFLQRTRFEDPPSDLIDEHGTLPRGDR